MKDKYNYFTYPHLSYEQIGLFFLHSKISWHGEVEQRVIIVDISDDYVHCSSGCLRKKGKTVLCSGPSQG